MSEKTIKRAQDAFKKARDAWQRIYRDAAEDLEFLSGEEGCQWHEADFERRRSRGRPALQIDQLGQFIHQTANDIRMNTPAITVIPETEGADQETAEFFKGHIKAIEHDSNADNAYDFAACSAIKCSIGWIRISHEYEGEGFEQKLCIKRVVNPLAVFLDPNSIEPDGKDAKFAFIVDSISAQEFKRRYKGKQAVSFEADIENIQKEAGDDDKILIAEYLEVAEEEEKIALLEDGQVVPYQEGVEAKNIRTMGKRRVKRLVLSGKDILEETEFPSEHLPIVPVYGEEMWINGERRVHSLIRKSKDAQRMFNVWKSLETELLLLSPKAQWIAAEGQVDDYMDEWDSPETLVLRHKQTDVNEQPAPPPQRIPPPPIPTGVVNASRATVDDIKATMGIYNAALGQKSNEISGIAINQRKLESDVATYHFGDNLTKSITQVGRILVSAIPRVYDTPRVVRIVGDDDEPREVGINGRMVPGQKQSYDLKVGKYGVRVITGAPYTTRRQEAAQFYQEIVRSQPELMKVAGDLLFKNMDFTGAPALAERMKKLVPPALLEEEGGQDGQLMQVQQQLQQAGQMIQQLQAQLGQKQENEAAKTQLEYAKIKQQSDEAQLEGVIKMKELAIKEQELLLRARELERQAQQPINPQPMESSNVY